MDTTATISELRALAAGAQRPAAARLRDLFDEVQAAIRAGVRRAVIRDALARNGLDMPFSTFTRTLARIRKERGVMSGRSHASSPETGPAVRHAENAPAPAAVHQSASAPAINPAPAPDASTPAPPAAVRERRTIEPTGAKLPDDWLTATDLTREQKRLLTPEQRRARADALVKTLWPNPFDPAVPKNDDPA
ncbi:hypothetical protein [Burkholderia ubonensis]|uniref:hypothetical protein n=1 Tax=Burkholderia ubonensis TaxID=101571 RepID=UPI000753FCD8|nr:hypothetical protein [Burkholderia ubonensis]KUZ76884.1 hypothetical protein WI37_16005 [Burkholderia ubonensis]